MSNVLTVAETLYRNLVDRDRLDAMDRAPFLARVHVDETIASLTARFPRGSGYDAEPTARISGDSLVITVPIHPMNDHGYYEGWFDAIVTVTQDLSGIGITVTVPDMHALWEDEIADDYFSVLTEPV